MNILKQYMKDNNLTTTALAELIELPVPTVWRYVNNKFKPDATNALQIQEKIGIPMQSFYVKKKRKAS
jgi:plasmid maintenance system antidote protein VapI